MAGILEQAMEIRKIWSGFQSARVLLTANNYRVFDYLKKHRTAKALAKDIDADRRAAEILLDALTGLGLVRKQKGRYKNTGMSSRYLVSGSSHYQGDIIKHADTLWDNWSGLDKVLRSGTPYRKSQNHSAFILGMHNLAVLKAREIVKWIGLRGVQKVLDLGGGPGTYAMEIAKKGIHVTLFDTPETIKIARRIIKNKNMPNIEFIRGDFLSDDIGEGYDLIFISQIFHSYPEKDSITVLKKCRKALKLNGRVVIQEFFIYEDRAHPVQSSLFSINMLVNTEEGRCYSPDEIKDWFLRTGFKKIRKGLVGDSLLISAEK